MDIFSIFTLLGGLALFLYGMSVMGSSLEKLSGNKLEKMIESLTSSPLKSVALGAGVTAIIQSSSATTVMVVGFVNSSIMKLSSAIGIIMGANIGTTFTSWILSLTGIESSNVVLQLFKPKNFSPLLAFIGIVLFMIKKTDKQKVIGEALVGFAVLMFGMESMSSAVAPLADVPEFINILTLFNNPIFGIIVGAILTAVIQSSSASVGILQALSLTGAFTYSQVIPIIMGQNIGTCVTAMISSIGANRNARRTAFIHLYFNLIGTILFLVIYFSINALIGFSFSNDTILPVGIAIVHTIFNICTTFLLLPFTKVLEKLAYKTLPLTDEENANVNDFMLLDDRFLATPSFALDQCKSVVVSMGRLAKESVENSILVLNNYDDNIVKKITKIENRINTFETKAKNYLTLLTAEDISQLDSQTLSILHHCITDYERIGDHATNVVEISRSMSKRSYVFSEQALNELKIYQDALIEVLTLSIECLDNTSESVAKSVEALEEVIDILNKKIRKGHLRRLQNSACTVDLGLYLQDLTTNFERMSDHCSNIAIAVLQVYDSTASEHGYASLLKENDQEFAEKYDYYSDKYLESLKQLRK